MSYIPREGSNMNNESLSNNDDKNYQDFKTYKPQTLKYLAKEQEELVETHLLIISNLRKQEMTAKEIHNLYYDDKGKKHSKTIKTIYRYLEKLEAAELVTIAGHRITKGSRVAEKLYSRTARVFILESFESDMCEETSNEIIQMIIKLIGPLFEIEETNINAFKKNFSQFFEQLPQQSSELLEILAKDEEIGEYFGKASLTRINYILNLSSTFGVLLRHPEILEQFRNLIN